MRVLHGRRCNVTPAAITVPRQHHKFYAHGVAYQGRTHLERCLPPLLHAANSVSLQMMPCWVHRRVDFCKLHLSGCHCLFSSRTVQLADAVAWTCTSSVRRHGAAGCERDFWEHWSTILRSCGAAFCPDVHRRRSRRAAKHFRVFCSNATSSPPTSCCTGAAMLTCSHVLRNIRHPCSHRSSFASAAVGHYHAANLSLICQWGRDTHHRLVLPLLTDPDPQRYAALIQGVKLLAIDMHRGPTP